MLITSSAGSQELASVSRDSAGPGQGVITVAVFNPATTRLVLHAGTAQPVAGLTWRNGPLVGAAERRDLVAAFNGGFKVGDSRGGWLSEGRTVVPLTKGAASVVVYADGGADIGGWQRQVPARWRQVVSVRQNLQLLIDQGRPQMIHPSGQHQLDLWWGHAFRQQPLISRSALGVTGSGALVWAAGTRITINALASSLLAHGAVRALELDVNAPLVRGFLFSGPATITPAVGVAGSALPLVAGQTQLAADPGANNLRIAPHCTYLTACSRDFFTVLVR